MDNKTTLRQLLDRIFKPWIAELAVFALLTVLPYVLFAALGTNEEKTKLLIAAPVAAVLVFGFVLLLFKIIERQNAVTSSIIDIFIFFFGVIMLIGGIALLISFLTNIKGGYSPTVSICFAALSALTLFSKIRKK